MVGSDREWRAQEKKAPPGTPQIQQVYDSMILLLAYTLAPMYLSAFYIPRDSGKTTREPTSFSTSTAAPCFGAEILGSEPPVAHLKSSRYMIP
ncbi:hypothetical protein THAOC_25194 [Thalassiosira oceanica]|uniref:Uncharacterized protein n=1 Tax=Thalassiosira oceanica TaxID=159749 RepID=K0RMY2_THAOC|nr:hypothetical protein THAOC_25194 [Thalassiosira oceanica]|eukprot:EJK55108.1 hypothetical protein THAOC_25194 [Thalassiosira oceanica]